MRIHYSKEADAIYMRFKETEISNTDELSEDIIADYDGAGNVVGIEILGVSDKADINELVIQSFGKVMVEPAKAA